MTHLIDKDALVAEIERRKIIAREKAEIASDNNNVPVAALWSGKENICNELLSFLDTLEVKEDKLFTETKIEKELAECYLQIFDKKFTLPKIKGKQLHDFKNFINTCEQTFSMKYFDYHATQGKLFEKLALLWAVWGKEHLNTEVKDVDLQEEIDKEWEKCNPIDEGQ